MAFYLTTLLEFSSHVKAQKYAELLAKKTRPMFEDDVDAEYQSAFEVIEDIEYPDSLEINKDKLLLRWVEKDYFGAEELIPLFEVNDVSLIICHEIGDDADAGDDYEEDVKGFYVYQKDDEKFQVINPKDAIKMFGDELVKQVSAFVA